MLSGDFSLSGFRTSPSPDDNPAGLVVRPDTCLEAWGTGANKDSHGYVCRGGRNPSVCNLGLSAQWIYCAALAWTYQLTTNCGRKVRSPQAVAFLDRRRRESMSMFHSLCVVGSQSAAVCGVFGPGTGEGRCCRESGTTELRILFTPVGPSIMGGGGGLRTVCFLTFCPGLGSGKMTPSWSYFV